MSTKNLARTVIEGGRRTGNTHDRRQSHGKVRSAVRVQLGQVRLDVAGADTHVWVALGSVPRRFDDKLSAAEEWMKKQVGRAWDRVQMDLLARFDTRTVAGRHVVFAHMLPQRHSSDGTWSIHRQYFRVDPTGVLRLAPPRWRERATPVPDDQVQALRKFAGKRRVVLRGNKAYWLVPVPTEQGATQRYRQDAAFTATERARWDAFPARARKWWTLKLA